MGPEVEIEAVEAINGGTLIQVDVIIEKRKLRLFINTRDILKTLNNILYEMEEERLINAGYEKIDPNLPNQNLIV